MRVSRRETWERLGRASSVAWNRRANKRVQLTIRRVRGSLGLRKRGGGILQLTRQTLAGLWIDGVGRAGAVALRGPDPSPAALGPSRLCRMGRLVPEVCGGRAAEKRIRYGPVPARHESVAVGFVFPGATRFPFLSPCVPPGRERPHARAARLRPLYARAAHPPIPPGVGVGHVSLPAGRHVMSAARPDGRPSRAR